MTTKWATPSAVEDVLTTELNALANGANKITTTPVSNYVELDLYADFILNLEAQGAARDVDAHVNLYILARADEVNYPYGGDTLNPSNNSWIGSFIFDAALDARIGVIRGVLLPPEDFHVLIINSTGQAFAATGNTLKIRRYNLTNV